MPQKLSDLNSAFWKKYKKDAGLEKAGWFKKHASVGKHIEDYQKARTAWKTAKDTEEGAGTRVAQKYFSKLDALDKAFTKFLNAKEFKSEVAKDLQKDITEWQKEISAKSQKLAKLMTTKKSELDGVEAKKMGDMLDKMGF